MHNILYPKLLKTYNKPGNRIEIARLACYLFCLLVFLFSGCGTSQTGAARPPTSAPTQPRSVPHPIHSAPVGETLQQKQLQRVQQIIQGMTLDEKLGQLIVVEYLGQDYQSSDLQAMIKQYYVGGFMYQQSNHNFDPPYNIVSHVHDLSLQAQLDARIPLLIATDQEGGLVNRLYTFHGDLPSAQDMAATNDPHVPYDQGAQAAKWLLELGINVDFAPVVDVQTVDPPVLVSRMFGRDPQKVATLAGAFLDGLQQNNVIGCLKHFPGLGAITSDPHDGLPTVQRSKADLEKMDLAPYKILLQRNPPGMIMSTDVLMSALDPSLPAELSPRVINGVLRGELGYNGVVITDGLYMNGISARWSLAQASVLSILAGNDLIEGPFTSDQVASVIASLKQALQDGRLTIDRINQSLQRILLMKIQYGIIT